MELVDLSRVIYDGMPKIPILPDVHVRKFFDSRQRSSAQRHRSCRCLVTPAPTWTRLFTSCLTASPSNSCRSMHSWGTGAVIGVKKKRRRRSDGKRSWRPPACR